jgi:acyl carrier protein
LGEIETSLVESEDVKEVVVTVSEDDVRGSFLCAYIVPGGNGKFNADDLKTHLLSKLPEYMIPSYFVEIEAMPLLPNGKVNRKMLPEPKMDDQTVKKEFEAPGTKTEKKIADIWSDILKRDTIGIHDNFFDLGGHSLLIPRLFNKLEKVYPGKVTITDLFEYLTIHQVARHIEGIRENESDDDLIVELSID